MPRANVVPRHDGVIRTGKKLARTFTARAQREDFKT